MTSITPDQPSGAGGHDKRFSVKARLTPNRRRRSVGSDESGAFVRRVLRAYGRRVEDGDVEALVLLVGLAEEIDAVMAEAVKGLLACGYSWAEIGSRLAISRQAATVTADKRRGAATWAIARHVQAQYDPKCLPGRPAVLTSRRPRPGSSTATQRSPAGRCEIAGALKRCATP
jgi:hypothetical protein